MHVVPTSTHRHAQNAATGTMTAVMRASVLPEGLEGRPRVLRVGLVEAGAVREDRLFKDGGPVTVGMTEASTFLVPSKVPGGGSSYTLFDRCGSRDSHVLRVAPGMTGRVALDGHEAGVVDLAALVSPAGAIVELQLSALARGRVVVGGVTLLFQLVPAPLPVTRAALPLAVKRGGDIDWSLTILAALSFLLHFGVVGAMYADWMDPIVDTEATVAGLVGTLKELPLLPPELPLLPSDAVATPETHAPAAPSVQSAATPSHAPSAPHAATDEAALSAAAVALGFDAFVALADTGPAVKSALRRDIPPVDLGIPAGADRGVEASTGHTLNLGHGTDAVTPGTSTSLGMLGHTTRDPRESGPGVETVTAGPRLGTVRIDAPSGPGPGEAALPGAGAVVAGLRAGFRSCYNAGIRIDPTMAGKVMLTARVAPNGEVADASASGNAGLSEGVVACLVKRMKTAQFEAGHPATTLNVPVSFLLQQ